MCCLYVFVCVWLCKYVCICVSVYILCVVCVCVYMCECVCVRASTLGYVIWTYFSKFGNNVNRFFIIRVKFYFKYFSQFNTKHSARKFHSLWIPLLLYAVSFNFENKFSFRKVWVIFFYQNFKYVCTFMISEIFARI